MVAVYRPCEIVRDSSGSILPQFKAVGYFLPVSNHLRYDMKGHWSRNTKHGTQFEVDSYDEVIIPSREGIIGYLNSGQIKGIGPRIAEKIYDAYGNLALEVLDKEPDKLLGIPGISQTRLTKICDSYLDFILLFNSYFVPRKRPHCRASLRPPCQCRDRSRGAGRRKFRSLRPCRLPGWL